MKKQAKLPNGQVLVFPDNTSDKVIQETVKRIMNSKKETEWTTEHVTTLVREITGKQAEIDVAKYNSDKKIDHYGPAIKDQTEALKSQNASFTEQISKVLKSNKQLIDGLKSSADKSIASSDKSVEVTKKLVGQLIMLNDKLDSNMKKNEQAIKMVVSSVSELNKTQMRTNELLTQLVSKTGSDKKVIRDNEGYIIGIQTD